MQNTRDTLSGVPMPAAEIVRVRGTWPRRSECQAFLKSKSLTSLLGRAGRVTWRAIRRNGPSGYHSANSACSGNPGLDMQYCGDSVAPDKAMENV
jgi:hypothetical protein